MTTSEPDPAAEPSNTAGVHGTVGDATTVAGRKSRWSQLNRTNRVAALVVGSVASLIIAAVIFGAGVLVGAEFGGAEGHHRGSEMSDYGADGQDSGEHEGSGSEGNGDRGDGGSEGNRDQGEANDEPGTNAPQPQPATPAPPRP